METMRIETDQIRLPYEVARKLVGKMVRFIEVEDGFMIKTLSDPIKEARGILKEKRFSTESYFRNKREEKAIEK